MKKATGRFLITSLLSFFVTVFVVLGLSFLYNKSEGEIIRNGVFAMFFSLGLVYISHYSFRYGKLDYDNSEHPFRFLVTYFTGLVCACLFPFLDKKGWFFISIAVALLLFSNSIIAAYTFSGFILITLILCNDGNIYTFFVYFLSSMIAIVLFQNIEDNFQVGPSIIVSDIILFVLEIAGFVMLENKELTAEQFVMPIANIAVNSMIMFFCLKYFNLKVANRYRNKYLELNDQEYKALIELKEKSKDEYFRSIHTAYLVERMANAIGCDVNVSKNCAYYHRIKSAFGYSQEDCERFVSDNQFPPKAANQLLEFLDKGNKLVSKESSIVYISDKLISTLMAAFSQKKDAEINYDELINTMYEKSSFTKALEDSELTYKDFRLIKEIMLKERLYYDFLR